MANNRRKSAAIALAVIGIAGLSLASASTLGIGTGTLQAGTEVLTDCQTNDVAASFSAGAYSSTLGYQASDVSLSNINVTGTGSCAGKHIKAALLKDDGSLIVESTSAVIGATGTETVTVGAGYAAADVKKIAVVISD